MIFIVEMRMELAHEMKVVAETAQRGQQAMQQLLQSVESALQLARHAAGGSGRRWHRNLQMFNSHSYNSRDGVIAHRRREDDKE
jgi:hypothetical protein